MSSRGTKQFPFQMNYGDRLCAHLSIPDKEEKEEAAGEENVFFCDIAIRAIQFKDQIKLKQNQWPLISIGAPTND